MILMIDNYDSFTFTLVHYLGIRGETVNVIRNDERDVEDILEECRQGRIQAIVISPGPGHPCEAGICTDLFRALIAEAMTIPVLGVCLGHQALALACDTPVIHAPKPVHGQTDIITHDHHALFDGVPSPVTVTRYHSLVADKDALSESLTINATSSDGCIMGLHHTSLPLFGVQFHPESIATNYGQTMIDNFISISKC